MFLEVLKSLHLQNSLVDTNIPLDCTRREAGSTGKTGCMILIRLGFFLSYFIRGWILLISSFSVFCRLIISSRVSRFGLLWLRSPFPFCLHFLRFILSCRLFWLRFHSCLVDSLVHLPSGASVAVPGRADLPLGTAAAGRARAGRLGAAVRRGPSRGRLPGRCRSSRRPSCRGPWPRRWRTGRNRACPLPSQEDVKNVSLLLA